MVILPGTRRPVLRVEDYLAYLEKHTYRNDQPRVRPPFEPLVGASPAKLASRRRGHKGPAKERLAVSAHARAGGEQNA